MHYMILTRVDGCASFEEAVETANDFADRHSFESGYSHIKATIPLNKFYEFIDNIITVRDKENLPFKNADELKLLIECNGFDNTLDSLYGTIIGYTFYYDYNDGTCTDMRGRDTCIAEYIKTGVKESDETADLIQEYDPEDYIEMYIDSYSYQDGNVILSITCIVMELDWDYGEVDYSYEAIVGSDYERKFNADDYAGYAIVDENCVELDTLEPPENFFEDVEDDTYFVTLDVHI